MIGGGGGVFLATATSTAELITPALYALGFIVSRRLPRSAGWMSLAGHQDARLCPTDSTNTSRNVTPQRACHADVVSHTSTPSRQIHPRDKYTLATSTPSRQIHPHDKSTLARHPRDMLPDLPLEIQDLIFDCAARLHPGCAPTLAVVSKRVQDCVERVIYEKIHLHEVDRYSQATPYNRAYSFRQFAYTLHCRPAEFFATRVRSIFFEDGVGYYSARQVLEACTALEHLYFHLRYPSTPISGPQNFFSSHTLQSLMTSIGTLEYIADSGIVFPRLRYLCSDIYIGHPVPALDWLPALHTVYLELHWDHDTLKDDAKTVMDSTKNLQVLGFYVFCDEVHLDVEQWRETVVTPITIKIKRFFSDDDVERWRALATNITDVLES